MRNMNKQRMLLQRRELEQILKLMNDNDCDYVTVKQSESTGIGSILTADFPVTVNGTPGEFRVEITGVKDW